MLQTRRHQAPRMFAWYWSMGIPLVVGQVWESVWCERWQARVWDAPFDWTHYLSVEWWAKLREHVFGAHKQLWAWVSDMKPETVVKGSPQSANLESEHGLKPAKKIRVGFLVMFLGPWQTSGVTKSMESCLDLHAAESIASKCISIGWEYDSKLIWNEIGGNLRIAHDSLVGAVRIEREDIVWEI